MLVIRDKPNLVRPGRDRPITTIVVEERDSLNERLIGAEANRGVCSLQDLDPVTHICIARLNIDPGCARASGHHEAALDANNRRVSHAESQGEERFGPTIETLSNDVELLRWPPDEKPGSLIVEREA